MSISINYSCDPNTVSLKLYIETGKEIDLKNLPLNQVDLDKEQTEYVYSDVVNKEVYSTVVEAIDADGNKSYSSVQTVMYLMNPGPGNNTVVRGRYDFGVMDILTNEEFGENFLAIRDQFAQDFPLMITPEGNKNSVKWYKCLVEKKVIFIPVADNNSPLVFSSNSLNNPTNVSSERYVAPNNGLFNTDGSTGFTESPSALVGGLEYKQRTFKWWLGDNYPADIWTTNRIQPTDLTMGPHEWNLLWSLFVRDNPGNSPGLIPNSNETLPDAVLGDIDVLTNIRLVGGQVVSSYIYCSYVNTPETLAFGKVTAAIPVLLELLD